MERFKLGADQAFELLVLASQRNHLKLRDLAEHLARTGELMVPDEGCPHGSGDDSS